MTKKKKKSGEFTSIYSPCKLTLKAILYNT